MRTPYYLLLAGALAFASCGNESPAEEAAEEMAEDMEYDMDATTNQMGADAAGTLNYFNETLTAVTGVGGDLTAIPAATAVSNIDGWIQRLDGKDGMYEIVEGLRELKEKLTEEDGIDGREVGTVLNSLGEDVLELNNPTLAPLANSLNAAGEKLGGL